ncbi:MAG: GNAT family N-acetyltransferase [Hyphomicrobiaceae bacterium]
MATPETASPYAFEALSPSHDRVGFKSGVEPLDRYFASQVTQDIRRRVSACFVAVERASRTVVGFYTIAASSIPLPDLAPAAAKKLPRYPLVPAVLVGRLAVALAHRGRGIGAGLVLDAVERALRSEIAAFAIVVDAKDDAAVAFYKRHGFVTFASAPMSLYLPLAEVARGIGPKPTRAEG